MGCKQTINDEDRRLWVLNDEGLYNWWRGSGRPIRAFIRANREQLDEVIGNMISGRRRQHYLVYG